jgi:antitoxin component YwqK of YwqJK toxin-antitoxin module
VSESDLQVCGDIKKSLKRGTYNRGEKNRYSGRLKNWKFIGKGLRSAIVNNRAALQ